MIILSKGQVLKLHESLIRATGGSLGIRDEGMLDMALKNPFQSFDGKELYPGIQAKGVKRYNSCVSIWRYWRKGNFTVDYGTSKISCSYQSGRKINAQFCYRDKEINFKTVMR